MNALVVKAGPAKSFTPLVLVLLLQLFTLQPTVAFSPLDIARQNVAINATLSNLDLASSQTSFIPTQAPVVKLNWLWVNCGIDNRGPVASIRVCLDLASDSVQVYFEFVRLVGGWKGVVHGDAIYEAIMPTSSEGLDEFGGAYMGPSAFAALSPSVPYPVDRFGYSVALGDNLVNAAGGGFNSVVRVWAEGSGISVYASECQYGISFENAQTERAQTGGVSTPVAPSDNTAYVVAVAVMALAVVALLVMVYLGRRPGRHDDYERHEPVGRTKRKETVEEEVQRY